jgi:hypothetical protein
VPVIPKAQDGEGSSSGYAFSPVNAWSVGFNDGFVNAGGKLGTFRVRAVRGGLLSTPWAFEYLIL